MRVPCAGMAQVAADVEPGTEKGSIVSVIGMATSIVINVSVLTIGVILGSSVLSAMPASVIEALNYLLPALFGALLMQFGLKRIKFAGGMLAFAILIGSSKLSDNSCKCICSNRCNTCNLWKEKRSRKVRIVYNWMEKER